MKSIIFLVSVVFSAQALATIIELQPGNSVSIKAGDTATVSCTGDVTNPGGVTGNFDAVCSGSALIIQLDTIDASISESFGMGSVGTCNNTLSSLKKQMGTFSDLKIVQFCIGSSLTKVRISAVNGTITSTSTGMGSVGACNNALN